MAKNEHFLEVCKIKFICISSMFDKFFIMQLISVKKLLLSPQCVCF